MRSIISARWTRQTLIVNYEKNFLNLNCTMKQQWSRVGLNTWYTPDRVNRKTSSESYLVWNKFYSILQVLVNPANTRIKFWWIDAGLHVYAHSGLTVAVPPILSNKDDISVITCRQKSVAEAPGCFISKLLTLPDWVSTANQLHSGY